MDTVTDIIAAYTLALLAAALTAALVRHFALEGGWAALALAALAAAVSFAFWHDGTLMLVRRCRKKKGEKK